MSIIHCKYCGTRTLLLLYLGEREGKIYGIISESFNDQERGKIIDAKITSLTLDQKIIWIKENCPNAYRNGYRAIHKKNITIISKHNIPEK